MDTGPIDEAEEHDSEGLISRPPEEKDAADLLFLRKWFEARGEQPPED